MADHLRQEWQEVKNCANSVATDTLPYSFPWHPLKDIATVLVDIEGRLSWLEDRVRDLEQR